MSIITAQAAPERNAHTFKGSAPGVKHNTPMLGRRGRALKTNAETLEHCGRVLKTNAEALARCASAHHSVYCH